MTRLPVDLLERSPEESARLVALTFVEEASAAQKRFGDAGDPESLHDFRVAIRRLRSTCRAYAAWLETSVSAKLRRRLRGLTEATNAGRDAEVLLVWVRERREAMGPGGQPGADWLVARLEQRLGGEHGQGVEEIAREWRDLAAVLKRRLSEFETVVHLGRGSRHPPFGRVVGDLIERHVAGLRERLSAVGGRDDAAEAHRARISAKRLRYLLEPLIRRSRPVKAFVERLKGLQDLLGELRDVQVLALEITQAVEETAATRAGRLHRLALDGAEAKIAGPVDVGESAGLVELARIARERADHLFAEFEAAWLGARGEPFLSKVDRFGESLAARRRAEEEIERKFLLTALPERIRGEIPADVSQGWIPGTDLQERVRRLHGPDGEVFTRTLKFGTGIRRTEIEEETTREVFDSLWPLTEGRRVEKKAVRDSGRRPGLGSGSVL